MIGEIAHKYGRGKHSGRGHDENHGVVHQHSPTNMPAKKKTLETLFFHSYRPDKIFKVQVNMVKSKVK